jgi:hypothetical protein
VRRTARAAGIVVAGLPTPPLLSFAILIQNLVYRRVSGAADDDDRRGGITNRYAAPHLDRY